VKLTALPEPPDPEPPERSAPSQAPDPLELGDFTATRRMLLLSTIAVVLGVVATSGAFALLDLLPPWLMRPVRYAARASRSVARVVEGRR